MEFKKIAVVVVLVCAVATGLLVNYYKPNASSEGNLTKPPNKPSKTNTCIYDPCYCCSLAGKVYFDCKPECRSKLEIATRVAMDKCEYNPSSVDTACTSDFT